eukprot:gene7064-6700_t
MSLRLAVLVIGAAAAAAEGPCDVYRAAGTPCVAAHSVVRAMYDSYDGPLYTVRRASDNSTRDIGLKAGTRMADAPALEAFCNAPAPTRCSVVQIHDQSGRGNHLEAVVVAEGNVHGWPTAHINPMRDPLSVGGHTDNKPGTNSGTMGFRSNRVNGNASGVAIGDEEESVYMVTSGVHYNE